MNIEMQMLHSQATCRATRVKWEKENAHWSLRPNHNMDPNIVNSAAFGQLWKVAFNSKEQASSYRYCVPFLGGWQSNWRIVV